jgi:hypothetical protein
MAPFGMPWLTFAATLVALGSVLVALGWAVWGFSDRDGRQ